MARWSGLPVPDEPARVQLPRYCPACGADCRAEPIPPTLLRAGLRGQLAEHPGHYSAWRAVHRRESWGLVVAWVCPACAHSLPVPG